MLELLIVHSRAAVNIILLLYHYYLFCYSPAVTHLGTNRARRRATWPISAAPLPLSVTEADGWVSVPVDCSVYSRLSRSISGQSAEQALSLIEVFVAFYRISVLNVHAEAKLVDHKTDTPFKIQLRQYYAICLFRFSYSVCYFVWCILLYDVCVNCIILIQLTV